MGQVTGVEKEETPQETYGWDFDGFGESTRE